MGDPGVCLNPSYLNDVHVEDVQAAPGQVLHSSAPEAREGAGDQGGNDQECLWFRRHR